eukprot:28224-Chlamydomonas_euryale.AAC.18
MTLLAAASDGLLEEAFSALQDVCHACKILGCTRCHINMHMHTGVDAHSRPCTLEPFMHGIAWRQSE